MSLERVGGDASERPEGKLGVVLPGRLAGRIQEIVGGDVLQSIVPGRVVDAVLATDVCAKEAGMRSTALASGIIRRASFIFTSRPVVRRSARGSVTRAAPLDVPVLVQDVFCCLHLTALSGQQLVWKQGGGSDINTAHTCVEAVLRERKSGANLAGFAPGRCHLSRACPSCGTQRSELKRRGTRLVERNGARTGGTI